MMPPDQVDRGPGEVADLSGAPMPRPRSRLNPTSNPWVPRVIKAQLDHTPRDDSIQNGTALQSNVMGHAHQAATQQQQQQHHQAGQHFPEMGFQANQYDQTRQPVGPAQQLQMGSQTHRTGGQVYQMSYSHNGNHGVSDNGAVTTGFNQPPMHTAATNPRLVNNSLPPFDSQVPSMSSSGLSMNPAYNTSSFPHVHNPHYAGDGSAFGGNTASNTISHGVRPQPLVGHGQYDIASSNGEAAGHAGITSSESTTTQTVHSGISQYAYYTGPSARSHGLAHYSGGQYEQGPVSYTAAPSVSYIQGPPGVGGNNAVGHKTPAVNNFHSPNIENKGPIANLVQATHHPRLANFCGVEGSSGPGSNMSASIKFHPAPNGGPAANLGAAIGHEAPIAGPAAASTAVPSAVKRPLGGLTGSLSAPLLNPQEWNPTFDRILGTVQGQHGAESRANVQAQTRATFQAAAIPQEAGKMPGNHSSVAVPSPMNALVVSNAADTKPDRPLDLASTSSAEPTDTKNALVAIPLADRKKGPLSPRTQEALDNVISLPRRSPQPVAQYIRAQRSNILNSLTHGETGLPTAKLAMDQYHFPFIVNAQQNFRPVGNGVVKVKNISWACTRSEIIALIGRNAKILSDVDEPVHIIPDRISGKTNDAYIEFHDIAEASRIVEKVKNNVNTGKASHLGDRIVEIGLSSQAALMKDLFPIAKGLFWSGTEPQVYEEQPGQKYERFNGFITEEEMVVMLKQVEVPNRSPFAKECPQRPFEYLISILKKLPWHRDEHITIHIRAVIHDTAIKMIQVLTRYVETKREVVRLGPQLLQRLIRAAMSCPGFSVVQKDNIAFVSGLSDMHQRSYGQPRFAHRWRYLYALGPKRSAPLDAIEWYVAFIREETRRAVEELPLQLRAGIERTARDTDDYFGYFWAEIGSYRPAAPLLGKKTLREAAEEEYNVIEKIIKRGLAK